MEGSRTGLGVPAVYARRRIRRAAEPVATLLAEQWPENTCGPMTIPATASKCAAVAVHKTRLRHRCLGRSVAVTGEFDRDSAPRERSRVGDGARRPHQITGLVRTPDWPVEALSEGLTRCLQPFDRVDVQRIDPFLDDQLRWGGGTSRGVHAMAGNPYHRNEMSGSDVRWQTRGGLASLGPSRLAMAGCSAEETPAQEPKPARFDPLTTDEVAHISRQDLQAGIADRSVVVVDTLPLGHARPSPPAGRDQHPRLPVRGGQRLHRRAPPRCCRTGTRRSRCTASMFRAATASSWGDDSRNSGTRGVTKYAEGIQDWMRAGLPVEGTLPCSDHASGSERRVSGPLWTDRAGGAGPVCAGL